MDLVKPGDYRQIQISYYKLAKPNLWAPSLGCIYSCSSFIFKEKLTVSVIINLPKSS